MLGWLLLAIACEQVPAGTFWPVVFGALTVPLALLGTVLATLYWLRKRWQVALLPALALLLTGPHFQRGLAIHPFGNEELGMRNEKLGMRNEELGMRNEELGMRNEELGMRNEELGMRNEELGAKSKQSIPHSSFLIPHSNTVRLLSANVRIFNVYAQLRDPDYASSKKMISWLADSPADILCLQEFYHEPRGSAEHGQVFRVVPRLGAGAGRRAFVSKTLTNRIGAEFGLAIFSRFPIVQRGVISFGKLSQNHAMWADLVLPGHDTIRVFNAHLQSMSLAEADIVDASTTEAGMRQKAPGLLRRFRNGAVARARQADTLVARLARSPYPVLLAGDLNDLPYSYPYDQLADHLQNAWATVGTGIGATYHGKLPGLRIDQQFAGPQWEVLGCRVHREIPWSDHFPVEALYKRR